MLHFGQGRKNMKVSSTKPSKGRLNVVLSIDHSAPDRRARVLGLPDEILPRTLMAPGDCKIRCGRNVFLVPIQNYTSGGTKAGPSEADQNCNGMSLDHS